MYSTTLWHSIIEMDYQLYGGPVSAEQNFDRGGRYLTDHPRRRDQPTDSIADTSESKNEIWYTLEIDSKTGSIKYNAE